MTKERPMIAVIINEANRSFFARSLYYLQKELFAGGVDVLIFSSLINIENELFADAEYDVYKLIPYDLIDGIIFYTNSFANTKYKQELMEEIPKKYSGPILCVEEQAGDLPTEPFYDFIGTQQIVKHLTEEHKVTDIQFVGGPVDSTYHQHLQEAFLSCFKSAGIELNEDQIHYGTDWNTDYAPVLDRILATHLPQAIVCCSDISANGIICALAERGYNVPEDVIVTGYAQNEPYNGNCVNITSTLRDPQVMSVNVARRMLSLIGEADLPYWDTAACCRLLPGATCGCRRLNLTHLTRNAMKNLTQSQVSDFESNYNFMPEDLIKADDITKFYWNLDYYTKFLGNFTGFWLCLNENILHTSGIGRGFTDTVYTHFQRTYNRGSVDLTRKFERSQLLPDIFEHRIEPAAFIVTSLHFMRKSYGYTVLSYGDSAEIYDRNYVLWLRHVTVALEKHRKQQLYTDATTDSQVRDLLTGLYNMRGYHRLMYNRSHQFAESNRLLRIISIDLDNLKGINESFGFEEGNKALCRLANLITYSAGEDDICVRVSGDEFYIAGLLDSNFPVDEVPNNLQRNLANYNSEHNDEYGLHVHIGIASAPFTSKDVIENLPYEAVYQRNMQKKNQEKLMRAHQVSDIDPEELKIVTRLINENALRYVFQPIIDAHSGEILAYEALMRSGGEHKISPITLLHYAEHLNRLSDIEKHTLFNTMEYYKQNQEAFRNRKLYINIIPANPMSDADFEFLYSRYKDIMGSFVVEFTEQTEANESQLSTILKRGKRAGMGIAIDDYGTGYSNINKLLSIMPDCVKLDHSLITNIDSDRRKRHFAKNIIDYAHDNHFLVLAEGVETKEELRTVIRMGFDLIQGYYVARPAAEPIAEIPIDIADEIRDINTQLTDKRILKTYFTNSDSEISLKQLDFNNYTDIMISRPEYTILGDPNFSSQVCTRIRDNTTCKLTLKDVVLQSYDPSAPCIWIGKNSNLTLNIEGNVSINGNIRVPEHSSLTIVGDGTLTIVSSTEQGYAIGELIDHSYGNIGIYLKNRLKIHIDSEKSVAIGGGLNASGSKIIIDTKEVDIEQTGKESVAIGTINGHANVTLNNTRLKIVERSAVNVGIGSFTHSVNITSSDSEITMNSSGDKVIGIGSYTQRGGSVNLTSVKLEFFFQAKQIVGIGIDGQTCSATILDSNLDISCEGAHVTAIGTSERSGTISMYRCHGQISVRSGNAAIFGATPENTQLHYCDLELSSNE